MSEDPRPQPAPTGWKTNKRTGLVGLLVAEVVSTIGTRMSLIAIPWLILITTHNPTLMGIVAGAETLAYVLSGVFLTPVADRIGIRRVSLGTDVLSAAAMGAVAAYHTIGFWFVVVMVSIVGILRSTGDKSKHVMLRPTAEAAGAPMLRVTAIFDGLNRVSMLVAAGLGGAVIAWLGPAGAIWFDAGTFLLCAALVVATVPARLFRPDAESQSTPDTATADGSVISTSTTPDEPATKESYLDSLRAGARFLRRDRLLLNVVGMLFVTNLFAQATAVVFIPLWVDRTFHSAVALGYVGGAYAFGAIVGNIGFAALAPRLPRYLTVTMGLLIGGAPRFFVLGLNPRIEIIITMSFIAGVAMSSFNPTYGALLYTRVPQALLTRMFGITGAITLGGVPLGGLVGAWLVEGFGLTNAIFAAGTMYFFVSLSPLIAYKVWRQVDEIPRAGRPEQRPNEFARMILDWLARAAAPVRSFVARVRPEPRQQPLRVTLAFEDGTWKIGARRGRKTVTTPRPVTAAEAVRRAALLELPGLCDEVRRINAAETAKAEQKRASLRDELARVEAQLTELELTEFELAA